MDVTVVIATKDRASRLAATLQTWARVQAARPWELVVVDNNSSDGTAAVIDAALRNMPCLRAAFQDLPGLGAARNRGLQVAHGRYLAFTDDDCYPAADYVDQICTVFEGQPHLGFLGGRILRHNPEDWPITTDERDFAVPFEPYTFLPTGALQGANMAFRTDVLRETGGFDPCFGAGTQFACEDIDAAAAALWAGFAGAYDPRPAVSHDHRRRTAAAAGDLMRAYDIGRGAYYAKYILNARSRRAYLKGWSQSLDRSRGANPKRRLLRECLGAMQYLSRAAPAKPAPASG